MEEWSPAEQSSLDSLMQQFPAEKYPNSLRRYIQIAGHIPGKNVRDVAMRIAWKIKRETTKKRKVEEALSKKAKQKTEREPRGQSIFSVGVGSQASMGQQASMNTTMGALPPLHGSVQVNTQQFAASIPQLEDHGAETVGNLGGTTAQLLEQNVAIVGQIRSHWEACRIHENSVQLSKFRDNILKILNGMAVMPGKMTQMPPLPVKLNIELASHYLS